MHTNDTNLTSTRLTVITHQTFLNKDFSFFLYPGRVNSIMMVSSAERC